jgi:hypothetical protein
MSRHSGERREQLAEPATDERDGHQFIGFSFGQYADRDHSDPFPELALAEQEKGVRDGMNFRAKAKGRRVQVSEQPERKGRFVLDLRGQLPDIDFGSGRRAQEFEVRQFGGRQRAVLYYFGAEKKVALKQGIPHVHARRELLLGLHFFG